MFDAYCKQTLVCLHDGDDNGDYDTILEAQKGPEVVIVVAVVGQGLTKASSYIKPS